VSGSSRWLTNRIVALFVASRLAYFLAGVRFDDSTLPRLQHFLDPAWLRHDLLRAVWLQHSQPPLYNLYLGLVLDWAPGHERLVFASSSMACGLVVGLAMAHLAVRLGVPERLALVVTGLFLVSPAAILYENLLFYTWPVTALVTLVVLAFHRSANRGWWRDGFALFTLAAAVVLTRSLFHLIWLALPLGLALAARRGAVRTIAVALLPLLLAAGLYVKNDRLFGFFGSSSWVGMSAARMTIFQIPRAERERLIAAGELGPIAAIRPYSPPEAYAGVVRWPAPTGVVELDALREANGTVNFDHAVYPEVSRAYLRESVRALELDPMAYLGAVANATWISLLPPSDFRPLDGNRSHIRLWTRLWRLVVQGQLWDYSTYPTLRESAPVEHYWLMFASLPFLLVAAVIVSIVRSGRWAIRALARGGEERAVALTILFLIANVLFVFAVGNLFEIGENNRFRMMVEPQIGILVAFQLSRWLGWNRMTAD